MTEPYEEFSEGENADKGGERKWKPTRGVVINLEVEKRLLDSLGDIAEMDGVNSVYQMIRNALYSYVKHRLRGSNRRNNRRLERFDD